MIDLGTLYKEFESRSGYPWLVCNGVLEEAGILSGVKGDRRRQMLAFIMGHQDDIHNHLFPCVTLGALTHKGAVRISPLILRALSVACAQEVYASNGPLHFLPDRGDRVVTAYALFSNIPVILTTDHKTFWRHRSLLASFGV